MPGHKEVYEKVFGNLQDQLASADSMGAWQKPWKEAAGQGYPMNPTTGRHYRGINTLSLWARQQERGYEWPQWAGYRQWQQKGGQVRRYETGTPVLIWRVNEKAERNRETGETEIRQVVFATMQQVFNICQQAGYPLPRKPEGVRRETDAALDAWFADTGAQLIHHGGGAFYRPSDDTIRMPHPEAFEDTPEASALHHYYAVRAHESIHFTGHPKRLDRFSVEGGLKGEAQAYEELIAEIGAAFLSALHGLPVEERTDHAQYLHHWRQAVRDKAGALLSAASKAQAATDYLAEAVRKKRAAS